MPILNYTTQVESAKSMGEITAILSNFGARTITTDYDEHGYVSGIAFVILIEGLPLAIKLPVNVEGVYSKMKYAKGRPAQQTDKGAGAACGVANPERLAGSAACFVPSRTGRDRASVDALRRRLGRPHGLFNVQRISHETTAARAG